MVEIKILKIKLKTCIFMFLRCMFVLRVFDFELFISFYKLNQVHFVFIIQQVVQLEHGSTRDRGLHTPTILLLKPRIKN